MSLGAQSYVFFSELTQPVLVGTCNYWHCIFSTEFCTRDRAGTLNNMWLLASAIFTPYQLVFEFVTGSRVGQADLKFHL